MMFGQQGQKIALDFLRILQILTKQIISGSGFSELYGRILWSSVVLPFNFRCHTTI